MEDYCDYWNAEWCKRFHNIKTKRYKTEIQGNTLYVLRKHSFLVSAFNKLIHKFEPYVEMIHMCKLKESALIKKLEKYGFEIKEVN